jgi:hypothetical protein
MLTTTGSQPLRLTPTISAAILTTTIPLHLRITIHPRTCMTTIAASTALNHLAI